MPSTSKTNQQKPEQQWEVEQHTRNWLDLPYDVMANILCRAGIYDILEEAQRVCTTWYKICKDPSMWRVLYMEHHPYRWEEDLVREMCKHAVDRSQGQLVDLTIVDIADHDLLEYIADRSSELRRLDIIRFYPKASEGYGFLKKFPLLEELSLYKTRISKRDIEIAGHYCPMLRSLKINLEYYRFWGEEDGSEESLRIQNEIAVAIGENLPELRHLDLIGNVMTNIGLQVILDGCPHLNSLDLRHCLYIDTKGNLRKECLEKIKCLKLSYESYLDSDLYDDSEVEWSDPYESDESHPETS